MTIGTVAIFATPFAAVAMGWDPREPQEAVNLALYVGWIAACLVWITVALVVFVPADATELRSWLLATRPPGRAWPYFWWTLNGGGAIWWAILGAGATLMALVSLAISPVAPSPALMWAGVGVVTASASIIIVSFAVHYARMDALGGGFAFPHTPSPRFMDFVYLAVQVSTTFGGSDVSPKTTRSRRAVAFHSVISSVFNTVLVALLVSVLLRAAGGG